MEIDLDTMAVDASKKHDKQASASIDDDTRTTALLSLSVAEKERFTAAAKAYGLSLSAFVRVAVNEYIKNHE